jgi:protocatechuate 3,4-dioxygenase beta subunit
MSLTGRVLCLVAVSLFAASTGFSQIGDAEMAGAVKDPSGAPVAAAKVTLTNQDSGVARSGNTDSDGRYRFASISPGRYSLKT